MCLFFLNQVERNIPDNPYTESYHKRVKARDRMREIDKHNEITLRKKYHLYAESSDAEILDDNIRNRPNRYQDLSLPNNKRFSQESNNLPDSAKLKDLNAVTKLHRRTSSDTSKDKKAGAFVHVKHKRKAPPPPPLELNNNNIHSLTPKSTTGRKKRQAPQPPVSPTIKVLEEASSATSLLGDKEIQAIIQGTSSSLTKTTTTASSPAMTTKESPKMDTKKQYVSPYLKIREDRKLTDEQKRMLLEQVTKSQQKNEEHLNTQATSQLTIENGQLKYQRADSPKITKSDKDKIFAPSSPISPRPWYKRANNGNKETIPFKKEVFLRTMEKRKKKDEKDLPEVGYSRNSFFESASKFNIFARLSEDSSKKKADAEKRRSQIGIPNISELDREAAEIIQRGHDEAAKIVANGDLNGNASTKEIKLEEEPINTKELIHKFESNSTHITRITVNTGFMGRDDLFGKVKDVKNERISCDFQPKKRDESSSKLPIAVNGMRKNNSLMGLWTCPYCTLENPNWKIICEACGKIKPYEKRYVADGNNNKAKQSPTPARKFSFDNNNRSDSPWDKKTELVKKYFHPPNKFNELSKSSSETFISNSFLKKSPSPTRRFMGSPKLPPRKLSVEKPEAKSPKIESIVEESNDTEKAESNQAEMPIEPVIITTFPKVFPPLSNDEKPKVNGEAKCENSTPDLNEIRSARLARFNTSLEIKKNQSEVERMNVTVNRKQSPEKKFPGKLDFSDPVALEREKERLREKIRAMNAKALAEKYPVLPKPVVEDLKEGKSEITEPSAPPFSPENTPESSKLGAIKKVLKKPLEVKQENLEDQAIALEEKIINKDNKQPEAPREKPEKISISVQTKDVKSRKKSEDLLPTTVVELTKIEEDKKPRQKSTQKITQNNIQGPEEPKETQKSTTKSTVYTNTLAINRILRNLENAISEGKHDEAAQFAKDLAKLKVPLSVTRQKDRPKSGMDMEIIKVK